MEYLKLVRIITTLLTLEIAASSPFHNSAQKSSLSPILLRHLLHEFRNGPQERMAQAHPEYGTLSPKILRNFDRYEWEYYDYDQKSRRIDLLRRFKHTKRQSGFPSSARKSGRMICARDSQGKCVAKCGFGAPLDEISINLFFGCKSLNSRKT